MDTIKKNRAFIVDYFNAVSGVVKTKQLCDKFMTDQKLLEHIMFFDGAFPKYELFIEEMICEGNKVLVQGRAKGLHTAEFNGIPPTYKEMDLPFVIRYTIDDGMIVDHWLMADQMILMQQLGVTDVSSKAAS